jgi:DNA-binding transcriptional LysR family regulator
LFATRRLTRLESRLGAALLTNGSGGIALSATGRVLLSSGRRFLAAVVHGIHQISDRSGCACPQETPRLRLAMFGGTWDALADDLAVHLPGLVLDLHSAEPAAAAELFDRRAVDAMYTWQPPGETLTLNRPARLFTTLDEPLWVALPAAHPCAADARVALADLAADRWIADPNALSGRLVRSVCAAAGFVPRVVGAPRSSASARSMINHGHGVALASPLGTLPVDRAKMVVRPLAGAPPRRHVLAVGPAVGERLAQVLCARLRHSYVAKATRRNPDYLLAADFPVVGFDSAASTPRHHTCATDTEPDGALLAGLVGDPVTAGADRYHPELSLEDLRVLKAIGACGSLNRAAPLLSISQPALSRRMKRLERLLGTALIRCGYQGTELTPAANRLLAVVAEAEAVFRDALNALPATAEGSSRACGQ